MISLDKGSQVAYVPMVYDKLLQGLEVNVRKELIDFNVDVFANTEDDVLKGLSEGCRRWFSSAK